jgi:hypothetical protein
VVRFCSTVIPTRSVLQTLKERGLLQSTTHSGAKNEETTTVSLESHLVKGPTAVYTGFDPTAGTILILNNNNDH